MVKCTEKITFNTLCFLQFQFYKKFLHNIYILLLLVFLIFAIKFIFLKNLFPQNLEFHGEKSSQPCEFSKWAIYIVCLCEYYQWLHFGRRFVGHPVLPQIGSQKIFQLREMDFGLNSRIALHSGAANSENNFKTPNCKIQP